MRLNASPKVFEGYKSAKPEDTISFIEEGFKKIGFSIDYYERVAGFEDIRIYSGFASIDGTTFASSGKGRTSILSKASAFAELAERFSEGIYLRRTRVPTNYIHDELEKEFLKYKFRSDSIESDFDSISDKIDIKELINYRWGLEDQDFNLIKNKYFSMPWIKGYSFSDNCYCSIPNDFIEYTSGTTGLASGNTNEEAIAQAISEIFERYQHLKTIKNKIILPSIDVESIPNRRIRDYIEFLTKLNIEIDIKDCSDNGRYPVMGVVFTNHNLDKCKNILHKNLFQRVFKVGSHVDSEEAIERCFTEFMQGKSNSDIASLDNSSDNKMDDIYWKYVINEDPSKIRIAEDNYNILIKRSLYYGDKDFLDPTSKKVDFSDISTFKYDDFLQDVSHLFSIIRKLEKKVYIVDWSHNVLRFPAVRVIIPGLSDLTVQMKNGYDYLIKKDERRAKSLHSRFHKYSHCDDWLKSRNGIECFLNDVDDSLYDFPPFEMYMQTFEQNISIHAIAFMFCLVICDYKRAYKYWATCMHSQRIENKLLDEFLRLNAENTNTSDVLNNLSIKFDPNEVNNMIKFIKSFEFSDKLRIHNPFVPLCYNNKNLLNYGCDCMYDKSLRKAVLSFFENKSNIKCTG